MALDIGSVRIGIAISDIMQIIASPYQNYNRKTINQDIAHINNIIETENIKKVVAGLPVSMDGSENTQCRKIRNFCAKIEEAINMPIEFIDERFSSVSAERVLLQANISRQGRKKVKDKLAASIFLQSYLDKINNKKGE
ncbi:MAG: Holliday junction resolvase RuvX [Clostridia bacterium]|nr:Holliday junction resolvase RuvX [Clostridia bacterium]